MTPPRVKFLPERSSRYCARQARLGEHCRQSAALVCLLDERCQALRVNRIIEAWRLGRVNEVTGRDMHTLLHPGGCDPPACWAHSCTKAGSAYRVARRWVRD